MAYVLCALENTESERCQEIASGQETGGRTQCESSALAQECAHLLQLWDARFAEDAFVLQFGENRTVFETSVFWHQIENGTEYRAPGLILNIAVFDEWDWITAVEWKSKGLFGQ